MSDTFDHAGDAFDDMSPGGRGYEEGYGFNYDPLYYHAKVKFKEIKRKTEKALLVVIKHKARNHDIVTCPTCKFLMRRDTNG